ncbi:mitochondrial 54S ribosomal protein YmL47, partial [Suillus cothurnatus]
VKRHKGRIPIFAVCGSIKGTTTAYGEWEIPIKRTDRPLQLTTAKGAIKTKNKIYQMSSKASRHKLGKGKQMFELWATQRVLFGMLRSEARARVFTTSSKLPTINQFITHSTPPRLKI